MPLASLTGIDSAGGGVLLAGGGQTFVTADGSALAIVGQQVASHGSGDHATATMDPPGHPHLTIDGVAAIAAGDLASCGDPVTGSSHVTVTP